MQDGPAKEWDLLARKSKRTYTHTHTHIHIHTYTLTHSPSSSNGALTTCSLKKMSSVRRVLTVSCTCFFNILVICKQEHEKNKMKTIPREAKNNDTIKSLSFRQINSLTPDTVTQGVCVCVCVSVCSCLCVRVCFMCMSG